jgi:hypothetical protein
VLLPLLPYILFGLSLHRGPHTFLRSLPPVPFIFTRVLFFISLCTLYVRSGWTLYTPWGLLWNFLVLVFTAGPSVLLYLCAIVVPFCIFIATVDWHPGPLFISAGFSLPLLIHRYVYHIGGISEWFFDPYVVPFVLFGLRIGSLVAIFGAPASRRDRAFAFSAMVDVFLTIIGRDAPFLPFFPLLRLLRVAYPLAQAAPYAVLVIFLLHGCLASLPPPPDQLRSLYAPVPPFKPRAALILFGLTCSISAVLSWLLHSSSAAQFGVVATVWQRGLLLLLMIPLPLAAFALLALAMMIELLQLQLFAQCIAPRIALLSPQRTLLNRIYSLGAGQARLILDPLQRTPLDDSRSARSSSSVSDAASGDAASDVGLTHFAFLRRSTFETRFSGFFAIGYVAHYLKGVIFKAPVRPFDAARHARKFLRVGLAALVIGVAVLLNLAMHISVTAESHANDGAAVSWLHQSAAGMLESVMPLNSLHELITNDTAHSEQMPDGRLVTMMLVSSCDVYTVASWLVRGVLLPPLLLGEALAASRLIESHGRRRSVVAQIPANAVPDQPSGRPLVLIRALFVLWLSFEAFLFFNRSLCALPSIFDVALSTKEAPFFVAHLQFIAVLAAAALCVLWQHCEATTVAAVKGDALSQRQEALRAVKRSLALLIVALAVFALSNNLDERLPIEALAPCTSWTANVLVWLSSHSVHQCAPVALFHFNWLFRAPLTFVSTHIFAASFLSHVFIHREYVVAACGWLVQRLPPRFT